MTRKISIVKPAFFNQLDIYIAILLCGIIFAVYFHIASHDFISFDDRLNVTENPHVSSGLSIPNIIWAFKFTQKGDNHYWHPLTSISHMLDCHLFGLNPAGHLLNNLFLHMANTLLLYILLLKMTSERWKSLFVAFIFAIHPLNVESVSWVAERKNVLSTFFWFLTMLLYLIFVKRRSLIKYIFVLTCMLLGLLCKPILVTLPCVLLLMDIWPLKRITVVFSKSGISGLIFLLIEKIPLFVFSAFWAYLSSLSMERLGVTISYQLIPMKLRVANALLSYVKYLWKMIWPFNLAIFYPFPLKMPPFWQVYGSALFLVVVSIYSISVLNKKPWLTIGWLWYIGTMFPVIGLVQNGLWPAMADRWAYVPLIGILVAVAWSIPGLLEGLRSRHKGLIKAFSIGFTCILILLTGIQIGYWKDSKTLFEHAVEETEGNSVAYNNLAGALIKSGNIEEGLDNYRKALKINPNFVQANFNIGKVLATQKKILEAESFFKKVIDLDPMYEDAYHNLGVVYQMKGNLDLATEYFSKTIRLNPELAIAHYSLGSVLANQGKVDPAFEHLSRAVQLKPDFTEAIVRLKFITKIRDEVDAKIKKLQLQLASDPENPFIHYRIALENKKIRRTDKAFDFIQKALSIKPDFPQALQILAIIYTDKKEYDLAIHCFKEAIKLEPRNSYYYYNIACIYSIQNKTVLSLEWLQKAVDNGYNNWKRIKEDKDLENIRSTPEFQALIKNASD